MVEADLDLKRLLSHGLLWIEPVHTGDREPGVISRGFSSAGYDLTLGNEFLVPDEAYFNRDLDPKDFDERLFRRVVTDCPVRVYPKGFVLATTREHVSIPRTHIGLVIGKSTYARCGVVVYVTPVEPGFYGQITLEIHNSSPFWVKIYPGEGIAQMLLLRLSNIPERDYLTKGGVYQGQIGVTPSKIWRHDSQ
jgi:dCTP deaminase